MVVNWSELLERLAEPFPAEYVSWRAGSTTRDKKRAQALPYAEPRVYEDRLNALCSGEWNVHFKPWGEARLICELTIHGVTRSSTGEFEENAKNAIAQGTVAEAQAFKRACSKFGLGRYLYEIPPYWVDYDEEKRRLLEIPDLASKFLPSTKTPRPKLEAAPAPSQRTTAAPVKVGGQQVEPIRVDEETGEIFEDSKRLTSERAAAMAKELEKLGFAGELATELATSQLGRRVTNLTELEDSEAAAIWSAAKKQAKVTWQSWSDPHAPLEWAKDAVMVTGERMWSAWQHIENSFDKLNRELAAAGIKTPAELNRHWHIKIGLKRLGLEYTPRRADEQRLIEERAA